MNLDYTIPNSYGKNKFGTICEKILQDLEYTCYYNIDQNVLNIAWDKLTYTKDKNEMLYNTALLISPMPSAYDEWLTNGIIIDKFYTTENDIQTLITGNYNLNLEHATLYIILTYCILKE